MELVRSYRRRGAPDFPVALYLSDAKALRKYTKPEYHPEAEIVLMLSGTIVMQLDGETKTYHKGDIYTIPCNAVHCYRVVSDDAKNFSLVFSTAAVALQPEHFFQKSFTLPLSDGTLLLPPLLTPEHPAYHAVYADFQQLQKKRIYEENYKLQRFSALIDICTQLLPYCTYAPRDTSLIGQENETVRCCMRYIHTRHASKLSLEELAQVCHLHPNYLCALFKKHTGQTIFEYLVRFRVETAAELLKKEDLAVSKIGELAGFHSESLFYRQFKSIMGISPKAYAHQHSEKEKQESHHKG